MGRPEQLSTEERESTPETSSREQLSDYQEDENRMTEEELERMRQTEELSAAQERNRLRREIASLYGERSDIAPEPTGRPEYREQPVRYAPVKPEGAMARGIKFLFSPAAELINLFNGVTKSVRGVIESAGDALSKIFGATGHVVEKTGKATGTVIEETGGAAGKTIKATGNVVEQGGKVVVEGGRTAEQGLKTTTNLGRIATAITGKIAKLFGG